MGNEYKIVTAKTGDAHQKLNDIPYVIEWDLIEILPAVNNLEKLTDFFDDLKLALTAYGYGGARKQLTKTFVKFNFDDKQHVINSSTIFIH